VFGSSLVKKKKKKRKRGLKVFGPQKKPRYRNPPELKHWGGARQSPMGGARMVGLTQVKKQLRLVGREKAVTSGPRKRPFKKGKKGKRTREPFRKTWDYKVWSNRQEKSFKWRERSLMDCLVRRQIRLHRRGGGITGGKQSRMKVRVCKQKKEERFEGIQTGATPGPVFSLKTKRSTKQQKTQ